MENCCANHKPKALVCVLGLILLLVAVCCLHFRCVGRTITVVGTATKQQTNETASFSATMNSRGVDKALAIAEVNKKSAKLVADVKQFGISDSDIQTQSLNIYRDQEAYYVDGVQKYREGDWNANITVNITVRDTSKVSGLTDIMGKSDISSIYGPSFALSDNAVDNSALLKKAFDNAKAKAQGLASDMGMRLGTVKTVIEGSASAISPLYAKDGMGAGGGGGIEPGSSSVSETLTVTFRLRPRIL